MNRAVFIAFFFLVTSAGKTSAQQKLQFSSFKFESTLPLNSFSRRSLYTSTPLMLYKPMLLHINYTIPKGAIFCRMEDALYKHLNFWVKFRMGTDDKYSN
jgi:hypothetical protein